MSFDQNWIVFTIAVSCASFGFVFYHFISEKLKKEEKLIGKNDPDDNTKIIILKRAFGFLIFGIVPSLLFLILTNLSFQETGFKPRFNGKTILWLIVFVFILVPINFFNARTDQNLSLYPEINKKDWSVNLLLLSALSWTAYLLAYEFLFRGILLFPSVELMGFWPATLLNTGLYSLVHIPKGAKETLAAIPMGIIFCSLAISTGSFWIAFFIHVILALSNEWYSLKFHPEIHFKLSK